MMIKDKVALITGGGSGIGRATAVRLAEEGALVWIVGRNENTLSETASLIGPRCKYAVCDVSDENQYSELLASVGHLDFLVSNAAVSFQTPLGGSIEQWKKMMDINMWGAVYSCLAAGKTMIEKNVAGRVVIVSSILGEIAETGSTAYGMAKAALNQLTRQLATEWADHNILVNAVAPGFVVTPMSFVSGANECESEWFRQFFVHDDRPRIPLKRPGRPEEIAECILFFLNPKNTYCTGQTLTVDGGLRIKF